MSAYCKTIIFISHPNICWETVLLSTKNTCLIKLIGNKIITVYANKISLSGAMMYT